MTDLLTAAQMRALEQAAIESGEVTGLELMERAGQGVVEAIFEEWPELAETSHKAVVLCGPGNNGGDGFVVARLLKERGWEVEVFLYGDAEKLPPDALSNAERWRSVGEVRPWPGQNAPHDPWDSSLIVDALFGTGLTRALSFDDAIGGMLPDWDLRNEPGRPRVVAVDLPSGVCSDSGRYLDDSDGLWADLTVSFHAAKDGHFMSEGARHSGSLVVKPIGLEGRPRPPGGGEAPARGGGRGLPGVPPGETVTLVSPLFDLEKFATDHKYTHGHALILAGPPGRGGAARLAARGALRIGAGLVSVACALRAEYEHASQLNAIMLRPIDGAPGLKEALEDDRINALCLGPGMGLGTDTMHLVKTALEAHRATVLDADALTIFQRQPDALFAMVHENVVLTPHAGEFARLFPDIADRLNAPATKGPAYSKVDATREAAARAGCTILFKGPDTVIADPGGRAAINSAHYDRAAPWLATAGSGDVLAGFITGLLARGFSPRLAAETAAWLHVEAALSFGPGLIAEDLPEELPKVFRALGL